MDININIVEVGPLVDVWPGTKNAYRCKVEENGNTFEANVPKAACELSMAIKMLEYKVSKDELEEICRLANEFGEERYSACDTDHSLEDEGV